MPNYRYIARDERGNAVTGTLAAPDPGGVADALKKKGYLLTGARPVPEGMPPGSLCEQLRGVGYEDLAFFNMQLARMVQVGIPLVKALQVLAQEAEPLRLRRATAEVAKQVEGGDSFSQALGRHLRIFPELFVNMVRAGEASGRMDEVLRRLAEFARHQANFRQQVKTALTYPCLLLAVGVAIVIFLLTGIIPQFIKIFEEANVPLPLPTLLLSQLSAWVRVGWPWLLVGVAALLWGGGKALRTPLGRRGWDAGLLKIPVVGGLAHKVVLSRFARTFQTLLSSGIPILEALSNVRRACGNVVVGEEIGAMEESVRKGGSLCAPLKRSRLFPSMVTQMVVVGETSGTLEEMMGQIADHYDEVVQHGIRRVTTLIEPIFLGLMAGMVAFVMASILLPLFRMVNVVG